jgi:hypothetical protein
VSCIGFIDNDILIKLIALDLFEDAITMLEIDRSKLQILPTARYVFASQKEKAKKYSAEIWDAAIAVVNSCQPIPDLRRDADCMAEIEALQHFRNTIDPGEQQLIVATRTQPNFLLMTGDKRCLRTLREIPDPIYARLRGRVVCLEQSILLSIQQLGFEIVKQRVVPRQDCDTALNACFGSGDRSIASNVVASLKSYIDDLDRLVPELLANLDNEKLSSR